MYVNFCEENTELCAVPESCGKNYPCYEGLMFRREISTGPIFVLEIILQALHGIAGYTITSRF